MFCHAVFHGSAPILHQLAILHQNAILRSQSLAASQQAHGMTSHYINNFSSEWIRMVFLDNSISP